MAAATIRVMLVPPRLEFRPSTCGEGRCRGLIVPSSFRVRGLSRDSGAGALWQDAIRIQTEAIPVMLLPRIAGISEHRSGRTSRREQGEHDAGFSTAVRSAILDLHLSAR